IDYSKSVDYKSLYNLAAYPQYVGPLREEVDAIIWEHGWKKEAIALMRKVDSFLAETQGLEGVLTRRCPVAHCYREGDILCP
ncbi:hypothetical protein PISMIDRAFT_684725, partial [Pisolithus microcarpus 441]